MKHPKSCCDVREELRIEAERLKAALAFTRDHNRKLTEENERLRKGLGVALPEPLQTPEVHAAPPGPIIVPVHPDLMPPPPPPPPRILTRRQESRPGGEYRGEKPLRTQWPLE